MVVWLMKCKRKDSNSDKFIEVNFNTILEEIKPYMSQECYQNVIHIIEIKKKLKEVDEGERIKCIDDWIESVLSIRNDEFKDDGSVQGNNIEDYDKVLHSILNISFK